MADIYGDDNEGAMYPLTTTDAIAAPLDSGKHNYTLTFSADLYPPANEFWSVTMYNDKAQLLIDNPINRYLIHSPMLPSMKKDADGGLTTIYFQKDAPSADKKAPTGCRLPTARSTW